MISLFNRRFWLAGETSVTIMRSHLRGWVDDFFWSWNSQGFARSHFGSTSGIRSRPARIVAVRSATGTMAHGCPHGLVTMEIGAMSDKVGQLIQPCVDCGLWTGRFCDYCLAEQRMPDSFWEPGQRTPLCSRCDNLRDACHYCLGVSWCAPAPHGSRCPPVHSE